MNKPKIIAYLKPTCGWSQGVRAIMRKYDLPFEDRDIINDPLQRQEMIEKSGHQRRGSGSLSAFQGPGAAGESRSRLADESTLRARDAAKRALAVQTIVI